MERVMQSWFSGPLGSALVRLLNMSAAAGALICVVMLLRALLRRAPKWTRGVLWAIVAVQLVCPVSLRSPLSVYGLLPRSNDVQSDQVEVFRLGGGSEKPLLILDTPQIAGYAPVPTAAPVPTTSPTDGDAPAAQTVPWVPGDAPGAHTAPAQQPPRSPDVFLPTAGAVWLAGVALMLLYALFSWLTLRRRVRASVALDETPFRLCDSIDTPFILGVLRPQVYLPSGLSDVQRAAVSAHEKAHLRRGDHWWKLLGWLLLSVHWFNPLVWLAYVLFCRDIELGCDERAVRDMDASQRADYSQALLDCAAPRPLVRVCPLAFGEVGVKARIKAVLNYKKPAFWIVVAAVAVCVVVAVCFLTRPGPIEVPGPSEVTVTATPRPTEPPEPVPTEQPATPMEPTGWPAVDPASSKVYWLDDEFYGDDPFHAFYITLDMDAGTFQFYETPISSLFGFGRFERDGDILTIDDSGDGTRVNRFRLSDDGETLVWLAEGSYNFTFVKLTDGATFSQKHYTLRSGVYEGEYFSIRIDAEAGTFVYNESPVSSHISMGSYGLTWNILTLDDAWPSGGARPAVRSNRFRVEPDRLVWLAEGSDNFVFVTLADGATFRYSEDKPRMTLDDVRALAQKGEALTWEDLLQFDGEDMGSGQYIRHFPIDGQYLLSVSGDRQTGAPQRVMLIRADESGEFYAVGKRCIDIRVYDVDTFLSMPQDAYLTVTGGGQSVEAMPHLLHERIWSREMQTWISGDGIPIQSVLERPELLPTITLADDFSLSFGGSAVRGGRLEVFDAQLEPLNDTYYGDTAVNWLAPGTYYCGVKVTSTQGRYVREARDYEDCVCFCVFRLIVPEGDRPAPYAPAEARDLVKAELQIAGSTRTVTDAAALAQLQLWLYNATELPGTGCPFGSLLVLTRADGRQFSLCPAEDSCGVAFADGHYYRFAGGNEAFWAMFGIDAQ